MPLPWPTRPWLRPRPRKSSPRQFRPRPTKPEHGVRYALLLVGLTGGIGVRQVDGLAPCSPSGALSIVDADQIARDLQRRVRRSSPAWPNASASTSCATDGALDRAAVAAIVFVTGRGEAGARRPQRHHAPGDPGRDPSSDRGAVRDRPDRRARFPAARREPPRRHRGDDRRRHPCRGRGRPAGALARHGRDRRPINRIASQMSRDDRLARPPTCSTTAVISTTSAPRSTTSGTCSKPSRTRAGSRALWAQQPHAFGDHLGLAPLVDRPGALEAEPPVEGLRGSGHVGDAAQGDVGGALLLPRARGRGSPCRRRRAVGTAGPRGTATGTGAAARARAWRP